MKKLKMIILINIAFLSVLLIFSINSKVYAKEKTEEIADFNYIPKRKYIFVENDNGEFCVDANGNSFFLYNMYQNEGDVIEIIYKNGTKHTYTYDSFEFDEYHDLKGNKLYYDNWKEPKFTYPDQWKEHWTIGTYYATMEAFGIKKKIPITVIETPLKSIKYIPVSNVRYTSDGERSYLTQHGVFFTFGCQTGDKLEVEYKDNTKKIYTYNKENHNYNYGDYYRGYYDDEDWGEFFDDGGNGIECPVIIADDQFYNNKWKLGKNNYLTVRFLGVEYKAPIELVEDEHRYETETSKNGSIIDKCCFCGNIRTCFPKTIKLSSKSFKYNGKVRKPSVTIKDGKGKKIASSNYTISFSNKNSKKVGEYTVKIKFKGNYKGTKKLTYQIKPKGVSLKKITSGSKKFKVKWNKNTTQTTGYQIQYATDNIFYNNEQKVRIGSNKTTSKTIKGLKAKKTYYVRIRTYKTKNGKRFYSGWSKALKVKTK